MTWAYLVHAFVHPSLIVVNGVVDGGMGTGAQYMRLLDVPVFGAIDEHRKILNQHFDSFVLGDRMMRSELQGVDWFGWVFMGRDQLIEVRHVSLQAGQLALIRCPGLKEVVNVLATLILKVFEVAQHRLHLSLGGVCVATDTVEDHAVGFMGVLQSLQFVENRLELLTCDIPMVRHRELYETGFIRAGGE